MWARRDSRPLGLSQTQGRVKTITQPALNLIAVNPRVHKKVGIQFGGAGGVAPPRRATLPPNKLCL